MQTRRLFLGFLGAGAGAAIPALFVGTSLLGKLLAPPIEDGWVEIPELVGGEIPRAATKIRDLVSGREISPDPFWVVDAIAPERLLVVWDRERLDLGVEEPKKVVRYPRPIRIEVEKGVADLLGIA